MSVTFGCCIPVGSFMTQVWNGGRTGSIPIELSEYLAVLERNGYDFAEMTVQSLMGLSGSEFAEVRSRMNDSPIKVPVYNSFIPPTLRVTGPSVSEWVLADYLDRAMTRVKEAGGEQIIFGSGAARSVPDGYPAERGIEQFNRFLRLCGRFGAEYDIRIAIEPLNGKESNIVRTVGEALQLARQFNLSHIQVLADVYHMDLEHESFAVLEEAVAGKLLSHVHISGKERKFPVSESIADDIGLRRMFRVLRESGYKEGVSMECSTDHFSVESAEALQVVKRMWSDS